MTITFNLGTQRGVRRATNRKAKLGVGTALIALCIGCSRAGFAADPAAALSSNSNDGGIPEITVTAQRRAENIQDVPISITAISSDTLDKDDVRGIGDLFAMTPNVSFVNNGSRDRVDLSIRGVSNQLDPYGAIRPASFAFYIDDYSVAAVTSNPQVIDMSRVEVLRGPQGTYFGRNAEAGAINITTNKPTDTWSEEVGEDYSSFNTTKTKGVLNIPVVPGLFDVRIAAQGETSDGNIHNINPIGGGNGYDYETGRVIARVTPNTDLTWDTTVDLSHENEGMRDGVPTGALTATWRQVYYHNLPGNVADPDGVGFYPSNSSEVNFNTPQAVGSDYYYVTSKMAYNFNDMALTVVGGFGHSLVYNRGDVDGSSYDFFNEVENVRRDTASAEVRLQSTGSQVIEWNLGTNIGEDSGHVNQNTTYGTQNPLNQPAGKQITGTYYYETDKYVAGFAQATYHVIDSVDVVLGSRYSYEDVTGQFLNLSNAVVTNNEPHREAPFFDFSPKFTINYKPDKDVLLYLTYSKGYKAGGVQSPSTLIQPSYLPEKLRNYEAGVKWDFFGRRLRLDVSAFHEDWENIQESQRIQFVNAQNQFVTVTGIANASSAVSNGADGSADLRLTDEVSIHGHGGYDQANYKSYTNALTDGVVIDASGKPLIDAPKWTAGATLEYERALTGDYNGLAQIEWSHQSKVLSSNYALRYNYWPFVAPGYHTFNLRLGVESNNLTATIYAENLFDAQYFTNSYEKAFYSGVQVVPSYRSVGVGVNYKF